MCSSASSCNLQVAIALRRVSVWLSPSLCQHVCACRPEERQTTEILVADERSEQSETGRGWVFSMLEKDVCHHWHM